MIATHSIPFKHRWLGTAALVAVALVAIGAIIFNATRNAQVEIDRLALINADQRLWTILEVEEHVIELQRELWMAQALGDGDVQRLRDSFDELVDVTLSIRNGPEFQELFGIPLINTTLAEVERGIADIDLFFQGNDAALAVQIPILLQISGQILQDATALCNASLPAFADLAVQHRDSVATALFDLGFIIVLMFWILLVSVVVLLYSLRSGAIRTSEISATRNRLKAMVSTSLDGILVADRNGRVLEFNGAARRIFGYARDEVIGQDLADLIVPDTLRDAHKNGMTRYLASREKKVIDQGLVQLEARDKSGRIFPVELSISAAESEEGEIFVSFIRDISARVSSEAELVEARDRAVAGERAKASLLAVMSHEMRTPLNGLLGSLQLLGGTRLNPKQRNYVEVMETSGQMLLTHVNDVLDISRADAGKIELSNDAFDLEDMLSGLCKSLQAQAVERGNTLKSEALGDVDWVTGDKARLSQVLVNLVGNALKFTENGHVAIEAERDGDVIEFRVIDTGIGISDQNQKKIFEDFVTLDTSFRREVEGTGLGLGIVKRLVALLGGQIGVESVVGEGSVFWVRVPLPATKVSQPEEPQGATHGPDRSQKTLSVLLVEDNEINRLIAREMLANHGCQVTEAKDGREGVEAARLARFDLIFCDISMPRMDGIEATKAIRDGGGPNADTPIIALTAHALPDDIQRFQTAGMNDVVVKPLTFDEVQRVLSETASLAEEGADSDEDDDGPHAELIAVLGKDRAAEVISKARSELSSGLDQLQRLIVDGAPTPTIRALAHKLAGVAAVVGYSGLHTALGELEASATTRPSHELETMILEAKQVMTKMGSGSSPQGDAAMVV